MQLIKHNELIMRFSKDGVTNILKISWSLIAKQIYAFNTWILKLFLWVYPFFYDNLIIIINLSWIKSYWYEEEEQWRHPKMKEGIQFDSIEKQQRISQILKIFFKHKISKLLT